MKGSILALACLCLVVTECANNIALHKETKISSLWNPTRQKYQCGAGAVDGILSPEFEQGTRKFMGAQSGHGDCNPWWAVDLGGMYSVSDITVYPRTDCCKYQFSKMTIEVFKPLNNSTDKWNVLNSVVPTKCHYQEDRVTFLNITCPVNTVGRFVRIRRDGQYLSLMEVQVYGNPGEKGQDCKTDELGLTYNGKLNTTITGRSCQVWALDEPHVHRFHSKANYFNYCRNPDSIYPGPWCYTTDPDYRFDFCPVFECGTKCGHGWFRCNSGQCILDLWRCNGISDCPGSEDESNCDNVPACLADDAGLTYRGKINVTRSGIPCQHWSSQSANSHTDSFVAAENYCRNYDPALSSPWCYILNTTVRWDYCDIPKCDKLITARNQIQ